VSKRYDQYCPVAHALGLVGERWALLIVRELLHGPQRYTDLTANLPKIGTNILSSRLKDLEAFDYQTGLFLDGTVCDDSHIKQIVGLKHLRLLTLANTRITDEGLKEITALKELEWVNVNDDAIGAQALDLRFPKQHERGLLEFNDYA